MIRGLLTRVRKNAKAVTLLTAVVSMILASALGLDAVVASGIAELLFAE